MPNTPAPRLLSTKDAAAYLGMCENTFREIAPVRPVDFGGDRRIKRYDRRALDRWLDQKSGLQSDAPVTPMQKWLADHGADRA